MQEPEIVVEEEVEPEKGPAFRFPSKSKTGGRRRNVAGRKAKRQKRSNKSKGRTIRTAAQKAKARTKRRARAMKRKKNA